MDQPIAWLLNNQPWVEYRTRIDLLHQDENEPALVASRRACVEHEKVRDLLASLANWPGPALKSHKSAGHPLHQLVFLADLGLGPEDPGMERIVENIVEHGSPEGPFRILVNINPSYGGTGEDQWVWMLCDAPLLLYVLMKFGLYEDPPVKEAVEYLINLVRENGWPCVVSPELARFRGPGRKSDPCPYATLLMLKLLSEIPELQSTEAARIGAETLLSLWEQRKMRRPYMFAMGGGFEKLKAPFIWYDLLHVTDVLTRFDWLRSDARLQAMVDLIAGKAQEDGCYKPESVWRDWSDWDFGQKREPSAWLTFLAHRALARTASLTPDEQGQV
jgi:hypothetical protein